MSEHQDLLFFNQAQCLAKSGPLTNVSRTELLKLTLCRAFLGSRLSYDLITPHSLCSSFKGVLFKMLQIHKAESESNTATLHLFLETHPDVSLHYCSCLFLRPVKPFLSGISGTPSNHSGDFLYSLLSFSLLRGISLPASFSTVLRLPRVQ